MKKILLKKILSFAGLLMLSSSFLTGCKKDGLLVKSKSTDSTVTTLATGSAYYYITPDNNGNLYALGYGGTTIYKYNGNSGKTAFYTLPEIASGDSTVVNKLECLTSDSLGNIYTVSVNNSGVANVLKITQAGSASTIFSNIDANNGHQIQYIVSNNGNFYFSDSNGIFKIAPEGSPEFLVSSISADFAVDKNGNVLYVTYTSLNNIGEVNLNQVSAQGVKSALVPDLYNTGTNAGFGTDIVTDKFGNIYAYVTTNPFVLLKINTAAKVSTVMIGTIGNVDGTFKTAEIGGAYNMVADPTGNIYFSQGNNDFSESYLRKITF